MEVYKGIQLLTRPLSHPVVTIGNFDGVHLGHQRIIQLAIDKAKSKHGECVVYTFRPHPLVALRPDTEVLLLSSYDEKLKILEKLGVDVVVEEPFNLEFSKTEPEQFFQVNLLNQLRAESIVVGYDFAFGKERFGHLELLESFCRKFTVDLTIVPPQKLNTEVISSSQIRKRLLAGQMEESNQLLGRPFSYTGKVCHGQERGRILGFPTANIKPEGKLLLPFGVYATLAINDGIEYLSVSNLGIRPTFQSPGEPLAPWIETHLFNVSPDLYGRTLQVQFMKRIREERKFESLSALKEQISRDKEAAISFFQQIQ
jgi:riboflavin kinase / FMN adenylyltransferase